MDHPSSSVITQVNRDEEASAPLRDRGTPSHAGSSSKKPRSRGIFHSLFCCLCHDETDHLPVNNNAPLLVEENGTISKLVVKRGESHMISCGSEEIQTSCYLLRNSFPVYEYGRQWAQQVPSALRAPSTSNLLAESTHMGECLECFPSDFCKCFGARMSFVESNITKYLESSAFFKSEHTETNMPAELCFGHSEVSGQGALAKENSADFCTELETSVDRSTMEFSEADGLCVGSAQVNSDFSDQSPSSGYSSFLDSCSEHSESFEARGNSVDLVEISHGDELAEFDPSENSDRDPEHLTLSELSLDDKDQEFDGQGSRLDDGDSFEENFQQDDGDDIRSLLQDYSEESTEINSDFKDVEPDAGVEIDVSETRVDDSSPLDVDETEQLVDIDLSDSDLQVDDEFSQFDPSDHESLSYCEEEFQEHTCESESYCSEHNNVVELDSEDCETSKLFKPNDQNKLDEYHATHFESPELCQDSKESKPSDHCVSLEQTQLTGRADTADDGVLLNSPDDYTCLPGTFEGSQPFHVLAEGHQDGIRFSEQTESSVCFKTLEQCSSCGIHFEKCDEGILYVPNGDSEGPRQKDVGEKCIVSLRTENLAVQNPGNPPINRTRAEARKPSQSDAMFSGSMETFEARWLSQFLTDLLRHNEEAACLAAENSDSPGSAADPGVVDLMDEVQDSDNFKRLCRKCEAIQNNTFSDDEPHQRLCEGEEARFDIHSSVDIAANVANSLDESSEEEFGDCLDGKSQSSYETDESFRSFTDESESFEIYTEQTCDKENLVSEVESLIHIHEQVESPNEDLEDVLDACEEAGANDSEQQDTGKETSKTYAEALTIGLPIELGHIQERARPLWESDPYMPHFIDEGPFYSEVDVMELCLKNEVAVKPQMSTVSATKGYELEEVVQNAFMNVSRDSTGLLTTANTLHKEDCLESPEVESALLENEVNLKSTAIYMVENEDITDLRPVVETVAEEETVVDFDESEGTHGPCCGEIETTEDEETSLFDFEDLEDCSESGKRAEESPTPVPLLSCVFEEQSNTEIESLRDGLDTESQDTPGLSHSPAIDDLPEEVKKNEKLEELIHQVAKSETSEQSDVYEDSDASEDEEFSEDCDCEICIPPVDQVPAKPLLPQTKSKDVGKICVVIDLDETLVHSSFKPVNNADFIIPVEIDGTVHQSCYLTGWLASQLMAQSSRRLFVYVLKRPHVDEFLKRMGELFECVLFTASLAKYADPVSDLLDKWGAFRSRLFRESCVFHRGNYVKDLSRLGRDLNKVPVASWFDDMSDTELLDLIPFFERLSKVENVYTVLKQQRTTS
ncbi:hypothetical protein DNTS_017232 [Danionella cerebrum]|uniref:FCP1 homology domain-containing protein n=1 Tax=Danionella cerebrum TaxID=2873325 RepID=A0A553R1P1_9TELE|nr:hypothetical protein DNTS_017232 [Danionella translucida]